MVKTIPHHGSGAREPQEVVILVIFFRMSTPMGQLALQMEPAARSVIQHNAIYYTYIVGSFLLRGFPRGLCNVYQ